MGGPRLLYPAPLRSLVDLYAEWGFRLLGSEVVLDLSAFLLGSYWAPDPATLRILSWGEGFRPSTPFTGVQEVHLHSHGSIGCRPSSQDIASFRLLSPPPRRAARGPLVLAARRLACIQCTSGVGLACYTVSVEKPRGARAEPLGGYEASYAGPVKPGASLDVEVSGGSTEPLLSIAGTGPLGSDAHDWAYIVEAAMLLSRRTLLVEKVHGCHPSPKPFTSCRAERYRVVLPEEPEPSTRIVEVPVEEAPREVDVDAYARLVKLLERGSGGCSPCSSP